MVEVHDIRKRFGRREALRGVSFELGHGCTAVLGPNGAGKTTLIRCIAGLIKADSGRVIADGRSVAHLPVGEYGYLPQHFDFFKELTAAEALRYIATLAGINRTEIPGEIERALASVNLSDRSGERIRSLSGGMLRRLGIAQTLLGSPVTLLYDEPTTGLDPEERARFKALLMSMKSTHRIMLSTHIVDDVQQVSDTVLVMNEGSVLFSGSPDLLREQARGRVRVSTDVAVMSEPPEGCLFSGTTTEGGIQQYRQVCREYSRDTGVEPTLDEGYLCVTHGFVSGDD